MRGAGNWDEYCLCCGLPFYVGSIVEDKIAEGELAEGDEEVLEWLEMCVGLDNVHGVRVNCTGYDSLGSTQTVDGRDFTILNGGVSVRMDEDDLAGAVIHRDCLQVYEGRVGRPLVAADAPLLLEMVMRPNDYQDQDFMWEEAIEEAGVGFFRSPLIVGSRCAAVVTASLTPELLHDLRALADIEAPTGNLNSIQIPLPDEEGAFNALMGELKEGNIVGFLPNNTGKIYESQGISAFRDGMPTHMWKQTLRSGRNPFTRAPIQGAPVYRRAHLVPTVTTTAAAAAPKPWWRRILGKKTRRQSKQRRLTRRRVRKSRRMQYRA